MTELTYFFGHLKKIQSMTEKTGKMTEKKKSSHKVLELLDLLQCMTAWDSAYFWHTHTGLGFLKNIIGLF